MSEKDKDTNLPNNEPDPTPASTEPATGSDAQDEPFRMPNDAPQHLRGKTADEIVDWSNQVSDQVRGLYNQQNAQPAPQPAAQPAQTLDPDLILTNPDAWQEGLVKQIEAQQQTNIAAAAQPILNAQADTARFMSQHDKPHEDVWNRWEHEIDMQVVNIPANLRTKALYDQAAELVKSKHIDELVAEKAQALASAGTGLDTGSNFLGDTPMHDTGSSNVWAKFEKSEMGRHQLNTLGKRKIIELCDSMNMDIEDYADSVAENRSTVDSNTGAIENFDLRLGG